MYVVRATHLRDLVALGSLTEGAATFLDASVRAGLNILVSGATQSGNPTWVPPEQPYPSSFRRYAVASAQPSVWWRLAAQLVAGVLEPPPAREGYAGRAPPLSLIHI